LSHAIEANNYNLVKLLVDHGANVAQVRVRENEEVSILKKDAHILQVTSKKKALV